MIALSKSKGLQVVMIAVPKLGLTLAVPTYYEKIAGDLQLPIESNILRNILTSRDLKSDAVHPNAAGYKKMAEAVANLLKAAKAIP
jgi:acyl-CoA thioesterase I